MRVAAECGAKPGVESVAQGGNTGQQPVLVQAPLHGERTRAGRRMPQIRVAMLEEPGAGNDRLIDFLRGDDRADRLVSRTEALGDADQVGHYALLLESE